MLSCNGAAAGAACAASEPRPKPPALKIAIRASFVVCIGLPFQRPIHTKSPPAERRVKWRVPRHGVVGLSTPSIRSNEGEGLNPSPSRLHFCGVARQSAGPADFFAQANQRPATDCLQAQRRPARSIGLCIQAIGPRFGETAAGCCPMLDQFLSLGSDMLVCARGSRAPFVGNPRQAPAPERRGRSQRALASGRRLNQQAGATAA